MFIAHLPAGYLLASSAEGKVTSNHRRLAFWCIVIGSILPDLDMFYFYLVDNRQTHHHLYWPHLPAFWLILLGCIAMLGALLRNARIVRGAWFVFVGVLLHLILDTPVGGIAWLHPLRSELMYWIEVPAGRSWWVWNFVFHWTFLVEAVICVAALVVWICKRRKRSLALISS